MNTVKRIIPHHWRQGQGRPSDFHWIIPPGGNLYAGGKRHSGDDIHVGIALVGGWTGNQRLAFTEITRHYRDAEVMPVVDPELPPAEIDFVAEAEAAALVSP